MSVSQALGIRSLLIMLISVQGTTPKNSSIAVQHWMAVALSSSWLAIQRSTATPNLAIFAARRLGMPPVGT